MRNIEIFFLGTSGGMPTQERALPSILVKDWKGFNLLLDIGEGVQYRMLKNNVSLASIDVIAITHSHGDHINGLPGLLQTLYMSKRTRPLTIICDRWSSEFIKEVLEVERIPFTFPIKIIEISGEGFLELYSSGGDSLTLYWRPSCHSIEGYMYKLVWKLRPRIDVNMLRKLKVAISGNAIRELLEKGEITYKDRVIKLTDVSHGPKEVSISYTGDTAPCKELVSFVQMSRVLIHDSTFDSSLAEKAHERGHSTALDAANVAKNSGSYLLILTHISTRYKGSEALKLLNEAKKIHNNVIVAWDGMKITLTV